MFPYRVQNVLIVRSRRHYVLYGEQLTNERGEPAHYHSPLPSEFGGRTHDTYRTMVAAQMAAERRIRDGSVRYGMTLQGHFAGASGVPCSYGCTPREEYRRGENGPWATANAAHLTQAALRAPSPPRPRPSRSFSVFQAFPSLLQEAPPAGVSPASGLRSVGVELECIVPNDSENTLRAFARQVPRMADNINGEAIGRDGSVEPDDENDTSAYELTFWSTDLREIDAWLKFMYDEVGAVTNASCGFHIHVCPDPKLKWAFASRGYWEGFYAAYNTFADANSSKFRARPNSDWCRFLGYDLDEVVNIAVRGNLHRYNAINLDSLRKHRYGAIEHRIMPHQDSAAEASASLRWLVSTSSRLISSSLVYERSAISLPEVLAEATPNETETLDSADGTLIYAEDIEVVDMLPISPELIEEGAFEFAGVEDADHV